MFAVRRFGGGAAAVRRLGRRQLWGAVLAAVLLAAGCGGGGAGGGGQADTEPPGEQPPGDPTPSVGAEVVVRPEKWYPGLGRLDAPEGVFIDVAVSTLASCGIRGGGELVCWGERRDASLWWGEVVRNAPVQWEFSAVELWSSEGDDEYRDGVAPVRPWYTGYIGGEHACGLRVDGAVVCWGQEFEGLGGAFKAPAGGDGDGWVWELRSGDRPAGSEGFVDLVAGAGGVCGIGAGGSAACWDGRGWASPALPEGEFSQVVATGPVCGLRAGGGFDCAGAGLGVPLPEGAFADISVGVGFGCGVRATGVLVCWGGNDYGQADPPGGRYSQVSAGERHACALGAGGEAVCWGDNDYGQSDAPEGVFAHISARWPWYSCGLRPGGEQVCWGASDPPAGLPADVRRFCEPGGGERMCWDFDLSWANRDSWDLAAGGDGGQLSHVVASDDGSEPNFDRVVCGLRPDQSVVCWQNYRQLESPGGKFVLLVDGRRWKHRSELGFCGLRFDRSVVCGVFDQQSGQLLVSSPDGRFAGIDGRGRCGVAADTGEVSCWASEMTGLVGAAPASALPLSRVSGGGGRFCGIAADDNKLVCWHADAQEAIDLGEGFAGGFADVALGPNGSLCAIRDDRSLACWGEFAGLENISPSGTIVPADPIVPPGGEFSRVVVARHHACAIEVEGAAVCWGHAHDGEYGRSRYFRPADAEWQPIAD